MSTTTIESPPGSINGKSAPEKGAFKTAAEDDADKVNYEEDNGNTCQAEVNVIEINKTNIVPSAYVEKLPRPMRKEGYYGILGDVVDIMEPYTEAPRESLLLHLLSYLGNSFGRIPFTRNGNCEHFLLLYVLIVGPTYLGRKGTGKDMAEDFIKYLAPTWYSECVIGKNGYPSGEGLLGAIGDDQEYFDKKSQDMVVIPGVADKRLMIVEEEFSKVLQPLGRTGNTLSSCFRDLWYSPEKYCNNAKGSPIQVTKPHVSLIGHIVPKELQKIANANEVSNGFFNRFLMCASQRRQTVIDPPPVGWDSKQHAALLNEIRKVQAGLGKKPVFIGNDPDWKEAWSTYYPTISVNRPGNIADLADRQGDQIHRIAALFAVLDGSTVKTLDHFKAAVAVWDFCESSSSYGFGVSTIGDAKAEKVLWYLRQGSGASKTEILDDVFHRGTPSAERDRILQSLRDSKLIDCRTEMHGEKRNVKTEVFYALA